MTCTDRGALRGAEKATRPYPPSWLNRLTNWIDATPGPAWLYYLGLYALLSLLSIGSRWLTDRTPITQIGREPFIYTVYPIYFVALMHYLNGEAKAALARFRPMLRVSDIEYARIEYELTTVPAGRAWIATALALVPAFFTALSGEGQLLLRPDYLIGLSYVVVFTFFSMASAFILVYQTVRQLGMVSRIHAATPVINLFQMRPAYAFSQLTARRGMGLMLFAYFNFLQNPPDLSEPLTLAYLLTGTIVLVAIAAFVLPLFGMHQRLMHEKTLLESNIDRGVESVYQEWQERIASRNFVNVEDLDKTLSSLLNLRGVVAKIPTWPWHAETLRGFVSALVLPILVWALTRILERYIFF